MDVDMTENVGIVDVVIPVYNGAATIINAVNSVMAQKDVSLGQIIIVDDGSTDGTAALIKTMGLPMVKLIVQKNGGVAAARNTGIANATAEWIAFLDADDCWRREKLQVQLDLATRHQVPFVCSAAGDNCKRKEGLISCFSLWRGNFIATSSVLIKREIALRYKPLFNVSMTFSEDYAAWFKVLVASPGYFTSRNLTQYVISEKPHYRFSKILLNLLILQKESIGFVRHCGVSKGRQLAGIFSILSGSLLSLFSIAIRFVLSGFK
jgi:hypothetical protein